jgi:hypothetical protein
MDLHRIEEKTELSHDVVPKQQVQHELITYSGI